MSDNNDGSSQERKRKLQDEECGRKMTSYTSLFTLLDFNRDRVGGYNEIDGEAILRELQRDPRAAERKNTFTASSNGRRKSYDAYPLHQAIMIGAPLDIVAALYKSYPEAIMMKDGQNTALLLACRYNPFLEVLSFLVEKWPDAVKIESEDGDTPLHYACNWNPSTELITWLLDKYPEAAYEQNYEGALPLHCAYARGFPLKLDFELVKSFFEKCPDYAKMRDESGWTFLHHASTAPHDMEKQLEAVSLVYNAWPGVIKVLDDEGRTPLYLACWWGSPLEVIGFLLKEWPDAVKVEDDAGDTPLAYVQENGPENILSILSCVNQLCGNELKNTAAKEMIQTFCDVNWPDGIVIIFDKHPTVVQYLGIDNKIMPSVFFFAAQHCKITTMWELVRNRQDLISDIY